MPNNSNIPQATAVAEKLLGVALSSRSAALDLTEVVEDPSRFFDSKHRRVAEAIFTLVDRGDPVDPITVADELQQNGELISIKGTAKDSRDYIDNLTLSPGRADNARKYGEIVRERSVTRDLLEQLQWTYFAVQKNQNRGADKLLSLAQEKILEVGQDTVGDDTGDVNELGMEVLQDVIDATRRSRSGQEKIVIPGLKTGIVPIDEMWGGLEDTKLYVLAGRPGMGKTSLMLCFLLSIAMGGHTVSIFSLEMSAKELTTRLLGQVAGLSMKDAKMGGFSNAEIRRLNHARQVIKNLPLLIHDAGNARITDIRAQARRDVRQHGASIVAIDYLQLMGGADNAQNREREIANISRESKLMAKELEIPALMLSQLNRSVENRGGMKRPLLADLRESGAIEQDADTVAFVYRPEVYDIENHDKLNIPTDGIAECITAKQRNGPVGTTYLEFDEESTRFGAMSYGADAEAEKAASADPRSANGSGNVNDTLDEILDDDDEDTLPF